MSVNTTPNFPQIGECDSCGWRGVPTFVTGLVSHDCPSCAIGAETTDLWERRAELFDPRPKLGRNEPCWCGSGLKFKRCHGRPV